MCCSISCFFFFFLQKVEKSSFFWKLVYARNVVLDGKWTENVFVSSHANVHELCPNRCIVCAGISVDCCLCVAAGDRWPVQGVFSLDDSCSLPPMEFYCHVNALMLEWDCKCQGGLSNSKKHKKKNLSEDKNVFYLVILVSILNMPIQYLTFCSLLLLFSA